MSLRDAELVKLGVVVVAYTRRAKLCWFLAGLTVGSMWTIWLAGLWPGWWMFAALTPALIGFVLEVIIKWPEKAFEER